MSYFLTNEGTKSLESRIRKLISASEELKFLVGFFYFSGLKQLYLPLKENPDIVMKVLVGLNVDKRMNELIEYGEKDQRKQSGYENLDKYYHSVTKSLNSEMCDNREFYEQVLFFIQKIIDGKLIIKKTLDPNHSKLYIFKLQEHQIARKSLFITGSSNLTSPGMSDQNEFNIEISDFGIEETEEYFDNLWDEALKITEDNVQRERLVKIIENHTHIKKITPYEAYVLVLKTYLDSFEQKQIGDYLIGILEKNGYIPYRYQLDAMSQALSIIENYNGVIIADVVGLGKTIIACAVAKELKKRGIVICPPGLMGDENRTSGWLKYLEEFQLFDWEVRSVGKLEETLEFIQARNDIEAIIVDEAHRFRNEDTRAYELLKNICRNKNVILLTATPFNNRPSDIFSLIKLFITPKQSTITLSNDLEMEFRTYKKVFDQLNYIRRFYNSKDKKKRDKAQTFYMTIFSSPQINIEKVRLHSEYIAQQIKNVIEPIVIRRNRIDLKNNPEYGNEIENLSQVEDPKEWFFELTEEQSKFYDKVLSDYFGDFSNNKSFKGAIYRPFIYKEGRKEELFDEGTIVKGLEENRAYNQQTNLFQFMRRLLVKRFESSFGAFEQSMKNFKEIHEKVLQFITNSGKGNPLEGKYVLDRSLIEHAYDMDDESIDEYLEDFKRKLEEQITPKNDEIYKIKSFKLKERFIDDILSDIKLFDKILKELHELDLVHNDPKVESLIANIKEEMKINKKTQQTKRKIIIFSEFLDTVKFLRPLLEKEFNQRVLTVDKTLTASLTKMIYANFDASYKQQVDDYDILLCTDKISEGFNLNRAGTVINYDIPWNPVRVIQRLGRINRIGQKVFEKLYIINFFPTEKGAQHIQLRKIAQNKMFLIHKTLGEDAKIFDPEEEPTASELYRRIQKNPDENEEESFYTTILKLYKQISETEPEVIETIKNAPERIKVSKTCEKNSMSVFFKKKRLFILDCDYETNKTTEQTLPDIIEKIKCQKEEKALGITDEFWQKYQQIKQHRIGRKAGRSEMSIETKALNILQILINKNEPSLSEHQDFLRMLREDILDFGTLSEYTQRRIALLRTNKITNQLLNEIEDLKEELGEHYLHKEKEKKLEGDKRIIIAIENKQVVEGEQNELF